MCMQMPKGSGLGSISVDTILNIRAGTLLLRIKELDWDRNSWYALSIKRATYLALLVVYLPILNQVQAN